MPRRGHNRHPAIQEPITARATERAYCFGRKTAARVFCGLGWAVDPESPDVAGATGSPPSGQGGPLRAQLGAKCRYSALLLG